MTSGLRRRDSPPANAEQVGLDKPTGYLGPGLTHAGNKQACSPELNLNLIAVLISHSTNLWPCGLWLMCVVEWNLARQLATYPSPKQEGLVAERCVRVELFPLF